MNNEHLIAPFFLTFLVFMVAWKVVVDCKRLSAPAIGFGIVACPVVAMAFVFAVDSLARVLKP